MRKITYICDRCGREIQSQAENPMAVTFDFAQREENDAERGKPVPDEIRTVIGAALGRDYCSECIRKIADFVKDNDAEQVEAERMNSMQEENECLHQEVDNLMQQIADLKKETLTAQAQGDAEKLKTALKKASGKAGKAVKPLDVGKIRALERIGWSASEIAFDMHIKEDEVKKVLKA